jgi:hypothetical protein
MSSQDDQTLIKTRLIINSANVIIDDQINIDFAETPCETWPKMKTTKQVKVSPSMTFLRITFFDFFPVIAIGINFLIGCKL